MRCAVGFGGTMHGDGIVGFTDAQAAALADAAFQLQRGLAAAAAARAMVTDALARGGRIAEAVAAGSGSRVREHDMALRAIAAEFAGILMMDDRTVQRRIGEARALTELYPRTFEAGKNNVITERHQRLITDIGACLPPDARGRFETIAITACQADTPGRVRSQLEIAAARLHPRTFTERHQQARHTRTVRVVDLDDGMSDLTTTLPTLLAHAVYDRLTAQGRTILDARTHARASTRTQPRAATRRQTAAPPDAGRAGISEGRSQSAGEESGFGRIPSDVMATDDRTLDQIRADVLADMLLTAAPGADPTRTDDGPGTLGAIRARVQVVVPALTALGTDDGPADLVGRAPIDAQTARGLLASTPHPIERILTDPITGSVIEVDTYARPASLDRYLRARDQRCRFPGCRLAAVRCEVDHNHDHALGGKTSRCNLCHLCQRHHSMKQFTTWRIRQLPGGVIEWTSPLGAVYTDQPPIPVTFIPDAEPQPRADDPPPF